MRFQSWFMEFVLKSLEFGLLTAAILLAVFIGIGVLEARFVGPLPSTSDSELEAATSSEDLLAFSDDDLAATLNGSGMTGFAKAPATRRPAAKRPVVRRPTLPPVGSLLGRLEAPTANLEVRVLEGTDAKTLFRGAGRIRSTALPGSRGNIGIAGHRDTVFRPLRDLKVGDPIVFTTKDRVLNYSVSRTWIVGPKDVQVLRSTTRPTLTLVTCYPFTFIGHAPQRYVVRADLVGMSVR